MIKFNLCKNAYNIYEKNTLIAAKHWL